MKLVQIGGRSVGPGHPCFIIAEAGVNHNGDVEIARRLVGAAAQAGADAVKFQTFVADRLASPLAPKAVYQRASTPADETQLEMLRRLELSAEAHRELAARCRERGLLFLSSAFDEFSADFLETLDVSAFKVPSGEITNLPLLGHLARKGRPMIISTGMSTLEEVAQAVGTCREAGNDALILLHCVSNYPAGPSDVNLRAMHAMAAAFNVPVGYSDHTLGLDVAFAAVALGACVLEKHFTLDRMLPGPDHQASLEPDELHALVAGARRVEQALGDGVKRPAPGEAGTAAVARKSLVAAVTIPEGSILTEDALAVRRPGTGLAPSMRSSLIGRRAKRRIPAGTPLTAEMFE